MNFTRRSRFVMSDDSFVISDSDNEGESSKSPLEKKNNVPKDPKKMHVIADSDSDSCNEDNESASNDGLSEDEDIRFMNQSNRVSILEDSLDSGSDTAKETNFAINKFKRRSIYDSPMHNYSTPKAGNTPITCARKKSKNVSSDSDNDLDDFMKSSKRLDTSFKLAQEKLKIVSSDSDDSDSFMKNPQKLVKKKLVAQLISDDEDDSEQEKAQKLNFKNLKKTEERSFSFNKSNHRELINIKQDYQGPAKENENKNDVITIPSSSSASDNDVDPEAIKIAKKEIGVGNIDPLEAQKKEYLQYEIVQTQAKIEKLKKFLETVDLDQLPDKGKKVIDTQKEEKQKLFKLQHNLSVLTSKSSSKNKNLTPGTKLNFSNKTPKKIFNTSISYVSSSDENKENVQVSTKKRYISTSSSNKSEDNIREVKSSNRTKTNFKQKMPHTSLSDSDDEDNMQTKKNIRNKQLTKTNSQKLPNAFGFDDFNINDIPNVPLTSFAVDDLGKKALETLNKQQSLTNKKLEQLYGSLTSRPLEDQLAKDPYGLNIQLMDHQKHALAWMMWREKQKPKGGILADDMGLGKTLSMISLILAKINEKRDSDDSDETSSEDEWLSRKTKHKRYYGGTLVVCPASLIKQWEAEVKNRCKRGLLTVLVFHGNNRSIDDRRLSKYSIVVTTYQTIVREAQGETGMYKMEWERVILDEAHYIRNHKSKACEAVCGLSSRNKWALTGTPIQNKEMDLYAILKFLKCSPFDDLVVWKRWVDNKNDAGKQRLITIMKTIMLRRTKQELQSKGAVQSLPEKNLEIIEISLDRDENLVYQKILLFSQNLFAQFLTQRAEKQHMREMYGERPSYVAGKNTQFTKAQKLLLAHHSKQIETHEILVLLLRLRQMCCHPALIHAMLDKQDVEDNGLEDIDSNVDLLNKLQNMSINEDEEVDEYAADFKVDHHVAANLLTKKNPVFDNDRCGSKVKAIMNTVEKILEKNDKLIIVSQWSSFLKVIAKNLDDYHDANYAMFTGEVAVKDRQNVIDKLNNPRSNVRILLLSLTAGGVGLNLVGANHLLLIDIHWNPQLEQQAQDRIYRFGQKKNVYIYKFICKDTIEVRVKELQDRKLSIAQDVLTGSRTVSSKLTIEDLKSLFS